MARREKTSIDVLLERTTDTGYVVLDSMAIGLVEADIARLETPDIDPATLPKAEDYAFWKRYKMVDAIHARVGR